MLIYEHSTSKKKIDISDFGYSLKKENGYSIFSSRIRDLFYVNDNTMLVFLENEEEDGGFAQQKYLIIDNGQIIEFENKLGVDVVFSSIVMVSKGKKIIKTLDRLGSGRVEFNLRKQDYSILHPVLLMGQEISYSEDLRSYSELITKGVNIQKGKLQNYFLTSFLDGYKKVIIPYKFIPELDLAMYKVYNNGILTNKDIKDFDKYELGILRNLIFAKYNYDFNSVFYQAYFNLYAFYNSPEMRKSRTKDVSNKLTKEDKVNLKLIKSME